MCDGEKADLLPSIYSCKSAAAVSILKVDPGSYTSQTMPFLPSEFKSDKSFLGTSLRLNDGFVHIALIAPVCGSNTSIFADFAL